MEKKYPVVEFEETIHSEGTIAVPATLLRTLRSRNVIVRLTEGSVNHALRNHGVSEDEIEHIATVQMESRDNILRFLTAEGSLARKTAFVRRSEKLLSR